MAALRDETTGHAAPYTDDDDTGGGGDFQAALDAETAAREAADALRVPLSQKAAPLGVATLDGDGLLVTSQLPPLALSQPFVVSDEAAMLALDAQPGDTAIRDDTAQTFILTADDPSVLANWREITTPGQVVSVNGQQGAVSLGFADVGADAAGTAAAEAGVVSAALDDLAQDFSAEQTARAAGDAARILTTQKGAVGGVAPLDSNALLPLSHLPTTGTPYAPVSSLWLPDTAYVVGQLIVHEGQVYRATTAHTSGAVFALTDGWTQIAAGEVDKAEVTALIDVPTTVAGGWTSVPGLQVDLVTGDRSGEIRVKVWGVRHTAVQASGALSLGVRDMSTGTVIDSGNASVPPSPTVNHYSSAVTFAADVPANTSLRTYELVVIAGTTNGTARIGASATNPARLKALIV